MRFVLDRTQRSRTALGMTAYGWSTQACHDHGMSACCFEGMTVSQNSQILELGDHMHTCITKWAVDLFKELMGKT
jgi:hypothetical protein